MTEDAGCCLGRTRCRTAGSSTSYLRSWNLRRLEPGWPVGRVRLLECVDLVVSEVQVERRDSFGQVMRSGRSDDRSGDDGVAEHPRQRDLGHADAAGSGDFPDGIDDRLVKG